MLEDRPLQLLEDGTRLEPELLVEHAPGAAVDLEGLRLSACAVEREHQLASQPLPQRMLRDQRVELSDQGRVAADLEFGVDSRFERRQPQLFETLDLDARDRFESQVGARRPAPQRQRFAENVGRALGIAFRQRPTTLRDGVLEQVEVELAGLDSQQVARSPGDDAGMLPVRAERLSQPRRLHAQHPVGIRMAVVLQLPEQPVA